MSRLKALLRTQQRDATAQRNVHQTDLLRVAFSRGRNTQQPGDSPEQSEARQLYYRHAERSGFTPEERDSDIAPILESPGKWIAHFREVEAELGCVDPVAPTEAADAVLGGDPRQFGHSEPPQAAYECGRCRHIDMKEGPNNAGRRQFQWTCFKGHRVLRGGIGLEDVLLAPGGCCDYDDTPPDGPGVLR